MKDSNEKSQAGARSKQGPYAAPFDVREAPSEVEILVDLPGIDEDDIKIRRDGVVLNISVVRDFNHDSDDAEEFTVLDRAYGEFNCSVTVPADAEMEEMTARYKRGVLRVRIPRKAK